MNLPEFKTPPMPKWPRIPTSEELLKLYYEQLQRVTNAQRTLHKEQVALQKIRDLMKARKEKEPTA